MNGPSYMHQILLHVTFWTLFFVMHGNVKNEFAWLLMLLQDRDFGRLLRRCAQLHCRNSNSMKPKASFTASVDHVSWWDRSSARRLHLCQVPPLNSVSTTSGRRSITSDDSYECWIIPARSLHYSVSTTSDRSSITSVPS